MENKFVIPGSDTEIVLKLKHELWADTMSLWEPFRPERYPYSQDTFYLLSATVITVIRSRYVNVSTQLIPI